MIHPVHDTQSTARFTMPHTDIPWEDNYIDIWVGKPEQELHIRKLKAQHYLATLLVDGHPVKRP